MAENPQDPQSPKDQQTSPRAGTASTAGTYSPDATIRAGQIAREQDPNGPPEGETTGSLHSDLTGAGGTMPNPVDAEGNPVPEREQRNAAVRGAYNDVQPGQLETAAPSAPESGQPSAPQGDRPTAEGQAATGGGTTGVQGSTGAGGAPSQPEASQGGAS